MRRPTSQRLRPGDFQFSLGRIVAATTICAVALSAGLSQIGDWPRVVMLLGVIVVIVLFCDISYRHRIIALQAQSRGDLDEALRACNRAIAGNPGDPDRYCHRAAVYTAKGDDESAWADYTAAIRLDSDFPVAWCERVAIAFRRGQWQQTIDDASVALCLDIDLRCAATIHLYRGLAYAHLNSFDEAFSDLDETVRAAPASWWVWFSRGHAHLLARQDRQALADFDAALERRPQEPNVLGSRCVALFRLADYAPALNQMKRLVDENPYDSAAISMYAWFLATCPDERFRDGCRALQLAETAEQVSGGKNPFACHSSLAAAYAELGQFDRAIGHAHKALKAAWPCRRADAEARLAAYVAGKPFREGITSA